MLIIVATDLTVQPGLGLLRDRDIGIKDQPALLISPKRKRKKKRRRRGRRPDKSTER